MNTKKKQKAVKSDPMPCGPLLRLVWLDATGWSRWMDAADFLAEEVPKESGRCETVGWLVHEDEQKLIVASSRSVNGSIDGILQIPKGMILKRTRLKEPR